MVRIPQTLTHQAKVYTTNEILSFLPSLIYMEERSKRGSKKTYSYIYIIYLVLLLFGFTFQVVFAAYFK